MLAAPVQELAYKLDAVHRPAAGDGSPRPRAKGKPGHKLLLLGLVLLAIGLAFAKTYLAVQVIIKGYELEALKKEIATIQRENERLQLEVARLKAPERIASVATMRLGMVEPKESQLYYVAGKIVPEKQMQVATAIPSQPVEEAGAQPRQSWLAALSEVLQKWLEPAQRAGTNG